MLFWWVKPWVQHRQALLIEKKTDSLAAPTVSLWIKVCLYSWMDLEGARTENSQWAGWWQVTAGSICFPLETLGYNRSVLWPLGPPSLEAWVCSQVPRCWQPIHLLTHPKEAQGLESSGLGFGRKSQNSDWVDQVIYVQLLNHTLVLS